MSLKEINEYVNNSKKEKNVVVKNFEEIEADLKNELKVIIFTIEGIAIVLKTRDAIYKLTENNDLDTIHFNNCEVNDSLFTLITWLNLAQKALAITNCNLTSYQGNFIFELLNPYVTIELDLSNNNLGENGAEFLDFLGKRCDENIVSLNLKGNGFKSEEINKFLSTRISDYDIYFDDIQEVDE